MRNGLNIRQLSVGVCALAAAYIGAPFYAAYELKWAIEAVDPGAFWRRIDRVSVADHIQDQAKDPGQRAVWRVLALADFDSVARAMTERKPDGERRLRNGVVKRFGLASLTKFEIEVGSPEKPDPLFLLTLEPRWMRWKVTEAHALSSFVALTRTSGAPPRAEGPRRSNNVEDHTAPARAIAPSR